MEEDLQTTQDGGAVSYNCQSCGGVLEYSPGSGNLKCPYCGGTVDIVRDSNVIERDFLAHSGGSEQWNDEACVYNCANCGSSEVFDKSEISHACSFCGTHNILKSDALAGIKPDSILPFAIAKDQADNIFKAWTKKLKFAPDALKKTAESGQYKGVYLPMWTFDTQTFSTYSGKLGKHYTVTVGSGKNRHTETRTRYFTISGNVERFFDDICVNAGNKLDEKQFAKISPFDTQKAVKYDKSFLVGFSAARNEKNIDAAWTDAKNKTAAALRTQILSKYDYDVVSHLDVNTKHSAVTFKYMLVPLWISNFAYNSKTYNFYINGTNGKITGKRPYSRPKILIAVAVGLAIVAAVAVLISKLVS
ncbi:MAG: DUF3268 family zinc-finger domain-containing protein [Clostridiales bacterium]|jgi:LSD1 subclass zinc finger protein|nr:DUF3268 family zinc-finger domain-containing protein [Clostridiales bacterium]